MPRAILALPLLLLACDSEPSFDERYDETQQRIEEKVEELDSDLVEPTIPAPSSAAKGQTDTD